MLPCQVHDMNSQSPGIPWGKTGATRYNAQVGLRGKGGAIKESVQPNIQSSDPLQTPYGEFRNWQYLVHMASYNLHMGTKEKKNIFEFAVCMDFYLIGFKNMPILK